MIKPKFDSDSHFVGWHIVTIKDLIRKRNQLDIDIITLKNELILFLKEKGFASDKRETILMRIQER